MDQELNEGAVFCVYVFVIGGKETLIKDAIVLFRHFFK